MVNINNANCPIGVTRLLASNYPTLLNYLDCRRLFIAVKPSDESVRYLQQFVTENGLFNGTTHDGDAVDIDDFNFHITVWYSKTGHLRPSIDQISPVEIQSECWELLGKNSEHLAIKFRMNDILGRLRSEYGKYGLTEQWPKYIPHMTMCYNWNKKIPRLQFPKRIVFDKLLIEERINLLT